MGCQNKMRLSALHIEAIHLRFQIRGSGTRGLVAKEHLMQAANTKILYFFDRASRYNSLLMTNLTHFFYIFIYYISLHVSSIIVLIIRRSICINTSSGMISLEIS